MAKEKTPAELREELTLAAAISAYEAEPEEVFQFPALGAAISVSALISAASSESYDDRFYYDGSYDYLEKAADTYEESVAPAPVLLFGAAASEPVPAPVPLLAAAAAAASGPATAASFLESVIAFTNKMSKILEGSIVEFMKTPSDLEPKTGKSYEDCSNDLGVYLESLGCGMIVVNRLKESSHKTTSVIFEITTYTAGMYLCRAVDYILGRHYQNKVALAIDNAKPLIAESRELMDTYKANLAGDSAAIYAKSDVNIAKISALVAILELGEGKADYNIIDRVLLTIFTNSLPDPAFALPCGRGALPSVRFAEKNSYSIIPNREEIRAMEDDEAVLEARGGAGAPAHDVDLAAYSGVAPLPVHDIELTANGSAGVPVHYAQDSRLIGDGDGCFISEI